MTQATLSAPPPGLARRFMRHRAALISLGFLLLVGFLCALLSVFTAITGHDPNDVNMLNRFAPADTIHWLGTDQLGRDVFLRLLQGGQVSLIVGLTATCLATLIGIVIGLLSGYVGGRTDTVLMRLTDGVIALPLLPLLIVLSASKIGFGGFLDALEAEMAQIILIIALFGWPLTARLIRAATLSTKESTFVLAAKALGAGHLHIIMRHILPNVLTPVIVAGTLSIGNIILLESVLSFLGLGIQPPMASWGNMLSHAQDMIWEAPILTIWPGLMIFMTVIAFNFVGDGLQDAMNSRSQNAKN